MAVSRTMTQFAVRMNLRSDQVREVSKRALQAVVIQVGREVVQDTPVDTGQARTNWLASIGSPSERTVPTVGTSPEAAFRASILPVALAVRANDTVFIVNALDYIADLNRGKSSQAGAGYFQAAVARGFRQAILLIPNLDSLR